MFTLRALSSAASLLLLTSCALEVGDPQTEPLGTATAEIKNGNVGWHPGVVALYYGGVRPCSGVYMGSGANGYVWVLTARHCVTTDGSLQGPLLSPSAIWATAQDNPGLTAPSLAVRYAYSYWQRVVEIRQIHPTVDLAMLRLQAPLDYLAPSGNTMPVYPSNVSNTPTSSFMDKELQCAGYGRAFNLSLPLGQENGTTGAGRARWARLTVDYTSPNWLRVPINAQNQIITNGDSGGPCWYVHNYGKILVGISRNSNSASNPTSVWLTAVTGNVHASWINGVIQNNWN